MGGSCRGHGVLGDEEEGVGMENGMTGVVGELGGVRGEDGKYDELDEEF